METGKVSFNYSLDIRLMNEWQNYLNENYLDHVLIEVDGGVKLHNAAEIIKDGADILVAGSEVFSNEDPVQIIKKFYQIEV